jgi:hypothetical protein
MIMMIFLFTLVVSPIAAKIVGAHNYLRWDLAIRPRVEVTTHGRLIWSSLPDGSRYSARSNLTVVVAISGGISTGNYDTRRAGGL